MDIKFAKVTETIVLQKSGRKKSRREQSKKLAESETDSESELRPSVKKSRKRDISSGSESDDKPLKRTTIKPMNGKSAQKRDGNRESSKKSTNGAKRTAAQAQHDDDCANVDQLSSDVETPAKSKKRAAKSTVTERRSSRKAPSTPSSSASSASSDDDLPLARKSLKSKNVVRQKKQSDEIENEKAKSSTKASSNFKPSVVVSDSDGSDSEIEELDVDSESKQVAGARREKNSTGRLSKDGGSERSSKKAVVSDSSDSESIEDIEEIHESSVERPVSPGSARTPDSENDSDDENTDEQKLEISMESVSTRSPDRMQSRKLSEDTSDTSVYDSGPEAEKRGRKVKSSETKTKKLASSNEKSKKTTTNNEENPKLAKLRRLIQTAGLRCIYKQLFSDCQSDEDRVGKLESFLVQHGLSGKSTLEECKTFRQKKEEEKELAELDAKNIISEGRSRRRNVKSLFMNAAAQKSESEESESESVSSEQSDDQDSTEARKECKQLFSRLKGIVDSDESD